MSIDRAEHRPRDSRARVDFSAFRKGLRRGAEEAINPFRKIVLAAQVFSDLSKRLDVDNLTLTAAEHEQMQRAVTEMNQAIHDYSKRLCQIFGNNHQTPKI